MKTLSLEQTAKDQAGKLYVSLFPDWAGLCILSLKMDEILSTRKYTQGQIRGGTHFE